MRFSRERAYAESPQALPDTSAAGATRRGAGWARPIQRKREKHVVFKTGGTAENLYPPSLLAASAARGDVFHTGKGGQAMLDPERIRSDPSELKRMLKSRFIDALDVDGFVQQDALRREMMAKSLAGKARRNQMSQTIAELKQNSVYGEEVSVIMNEMRSLGWEIAAMDVDIAELEDKLEAFLQSAPNYPHASVPVGRSDRDDREVYRFGERCGAAGDAEPFWNISSKLKILDFDSAAMAGGPQDAVYRGLGAKLARAVHEFSLDSLLRAGYRRLAIPYLVLGDGTQNGARLPERDQSVFGLFQGRVFNDSDLPTRHCAVSADSRIEPAPGESVELLTICRPEDSDGELSAMAEQARRLLEDLGLPGRVTLRCTGRTPSYAAKTYGLEVWMPASGRYAAVAECSNCEAYLARRLDVRYRDSARGKPRLCHTLSGSGLAVRLTVAAILENHWGGDGSVAVPECLRPYMNTDRIR